MAVGATGSGAGSREGGELEGAGASCVLGKPILPSDLSEALVRHGVVGPGQRLPERLSRKAQH